MASETMIATRATIAIGPLSVDGFMLPDESYQMSQTQTAEAIGLNEINARCFLGSKYIKGVLGKGYTPDTLAVEMKTATQTRHYLHGDQRDGDYYYCASCDLFGPSDHFYNGECHCKDDYQKYLQTLSIWKRAKKAGRRLTFYRPDDVYNWFE